MSRRHFSRESKQSALEELVSGRSIQEVSHAFGVTPHALRRWRREAAAFGGNAFPGNGKSRRVRQQRTLSLVFRITPDEYERVLSAYRASGARSLSDFARQQVLDAGPDDSISQMEATVRRLTEAVSNLSRPKIAPAVLSH